MKRRSASGLLLLSALAACSSGARPTSYRGLTPAAQARADGGRPAYTPADVHFISGMISHHAQAVLMAGWARTHGAGTAVSVLCERIVVAQTDEIALFESWLRDRGEFVPPADPRGHIMPGMDHPTLMPGMLTPEQMEQLDRARGPEFDRLFLAFMIQHHQGALTMVDQLLGSNGAAQEVLIYKLASDISADQTTEIERMSLMLEALPAAARRQQ